MSFVKSDPGDPKRGIQISYQWHGPGSLEKTADPVGSIDDRDRAPRRGAADVADAPAGPGRSSSHGRQPGDGSITPRRDCFHSLHGPFVVLFARDSAHKAGDGGPIPEDPAYHHLESCLPKVLKVQRQVSLLPAQA